jgi:hypothetical protein
MRVKKAIIVASTCAFVVFLIIIGNLFVLNKKDYEDFQTLLKQADNISHFGSQNAYQKRENIQKDIWIGEKLDQRHIRINSNISELFLTLKKDKMDILENLYDIECAIQDKTTASNIQHIRYFTAKNGSYLFRAHKFLANDTSIYFFKFPGKDLPTVLDFKNAYLQGNAQSLSFLLSEKKPCFNVSSFKAKIYPERGAP